jgi:hypothetical protein
LTFLLGYVNILITVYYLAIKNSPELLEVFPRFVPFAVLASVIGIPLCVGIGLVHLKRSGLFGSEQDIAIEANPYQYKIPPGIPKEVDRPLMLLQTRILRRLGETSGVLTSSEKEQLDNLERQMQVLIEGGSVGKPRRAF